MSVVIFIVLGSLAGIVARAMVNHSLVLAAVVIVASSSWAGPSSAADAPDAWITTAAKVRLIANSDTPARDINVDRLTALTLARTTDGVRSVVGELTVKAQ